MNPISRFVALSVLMLSFGSCQRAESPLSPASVGSDDALPENPLGLHPLTASVDPENQTMYTLYGNDIAFGHARHPQGKSYPPGAVLYEVYWAQKADPEWFGAQIPETIIQVEQIRIGQDGQPKYQRYEGRPLRAVATPHPEMRMEAILQERMAVSP